MKRNYPFLIVLAIVFVACQQPQIAAPPPKVDLDAAKKEVTTMLDDYHGAMKSKNASQMANLFAEDGLYCGTDPNELWDKEAFSDFIRQAFADTAVVTNYTVERRKVKMSPDGKSAITVEQFIDAYSPKILVRVVSHLVKDSISWKLDFTSWALVPNNADVPKINQALTDAEQGTTTSTTEQ